MFSERERAGKWNDKNCADVRPFLCEISASDQFPAPQVYCPLCCMCTVLFPPQPDWTKCSLNENLGSAGFMEYRDSCYKAVTNQMSFAEAEAQCTKQVMRYSCLSFIYHTVCVRNI